MGTDGNEAGAEESAGKLDIGGLLDKEILWSGLAMLETSLKVF